MEKQFETTMKRRSHRERFYSSMNYDEYCDVYGPPSPLFKYLKLNKDLRRIHCRTFRCSTSRNHPSSKTNQKSNRKRLLPWPA